MLCAFFWSSHTWSNKPGGTGAGGSFVASAHPKQHPHSASAFAPTVVSAACVCVPLVTFLKQSLSLWGGGSQLVVLLPLS